MNFKLYCVLLTSLFIWNEALAVQVAFMQGYNDQGELIELSPGERFYHVAIQVDGLWYDSLPGRPVKGRKDLQVPNGAKLTHVLSSDSYRLTAADMEPYLGLEFDFKYRWNAPGCTYCSKLIANVFGMAPKYAGFSGSHWNLTDKSRLAKAAISPDEVFHKLIEMGFRNVSFSLQLKAPNPAQCHSFL